MQRHSLTVFQIGCTYISLFLPGCRLTSPPTPFTPREPSPHLSRLRLWNVLQGFSLANKNLQIILTTLLKCRVSVHGINMLPLADPEFLEEANLLGNSFESESWAVSDDTLQSYVENPPLLGPLIFNYMGENRYIQEVDLDAGKRSANALSSPSDRSGAPDDWFCNSDIGSWPQRLLHVKSMTSYEWSSGNVYGGHVAPRYNAISYTWGRFDVNWMENVGKRVFRKVKSIDIKGLPWSDAIPRIHPDHFTTTEFQGVINRACILSPDDAVEFVWVDIACIDQRDGPQKKGEIGRQAAIFRGAQMAFVWLTRLKSSKLQRVLECLSSCAGERCDYSCATDPTTLA